MKCFIKKCLILLTLAIFIITGCNNNTQVKPLKPIHVASGDWEPYVGQNLENNGPVAQMISTILIELDYLPIFKFYDWGFIHPHLDAGYPGFAFPYLKGDHLKGNDTLKYKYSIPIVKLDYVLFYYDKANKLEYNFESVDKIVEANMKIGLIKGYTKFPGLDNDSIYTEVPNALEGFEKLVNGSIDFLLEAKNVGQQLTLSGKIKADASHFNYLGKAMQPNKKDNSVFVKNLSYRIKFSSKVSNEFISSINSAIKKCTGTDYYKSLEAKANELPKEELQAHIISLDNSPVYGYRSSLKEQPDYVLPSSSKVVVVNWNEIFYSQINKKEKIHAQLRSQVKIIKGPLKGKVLWVENKQIELVKK